MKIDMKNAFKNLLTDVPPRMMTYILLMLLFNLLDCLTFTAGNILSEDFIHSELNILAKWMVLNYGLLVTNIIIKIGGSIFMVFLILIAFQLIKRVKNEYRKQIFTKFYILFPLIAALVFLIGTITNIIGILINWR